MLSRLSSICVLILLLPGALWGAFRFFEDGEVARIYLDERAAPPVSRATGDLALDIGRVTRKASVVLGELSEGPEPLILIGQLGEGGVIDELAEVGLLDVESVESRWEAFLIQEVNTELHGLGHALVIAGSDMRGTIYGIYEVSQRIGVSPWYWWADVPVFVDPGVSIDAETPITSAPSVKYRGIFINDEDWGLEPWASKTFDPESGTIGPKTYARIFELLLRLKANTIWPAMHACTTAFHKVPGNADMADRYGIVLGSSHAEPMLRNNVDEWKGPKNHYNFIEHRDEVVDYWRERVKERTNGESLFTLGMRGIHDSSIIGPRTMGERVATLEDIITTQRGLLETWLGEGDPTSVGQIFCPYKEVLEDYEAGLRVPEDVIIVWPDDNFGYVRRFASAEEQARSGGLGVYYHLSYLGSPMSWLWFDSQPLALVWSEMIRAYEHGADALWIGNVGDIKGNERSMEFFLNMAWNAEGSQPGTAQSFMLGMAERDFGKEFAADIVDLWNRHGKLAFDRKPEHLSWNFPLTPYQPTKLTETEIQERLEAYASLVHSVDVVENKLRKEELDAFYQLVAYPIRASAAYNERYFSSELARKFLARGEVAAAKALYAKVEPAMKLVETLTRKYNKGISNGKWAHVMSIAGLNENAWARFQPQRDLPALDDPECLQAIQASGPEPVHTKPLHPKGSRTGDFVERDCVISIHAGHFSSSTSMPCGGEWTIIPGLGRSGSAVTVRPSTVEIESSETAPRLTYRFHVSTTGPATLHIRLLPTFPLIAEHGLRIGISIDDGNVIPMTVVDGFDTHTDSWKTRVLKNATTASIALPAKLSPGWHTLHLVAVDAGVVVDTMVIDLGGLHPSYNGPKETRID